LATFTEDDIDPTPSGARLTEDDLDAPLVADASPPPAAAPAPTRAPSSRFMAEVQRAAATAPPSDETGVRAEASRRVGHVNPVAVVVNSAGRALGVERIGHGIVGALTPGDTYEAAADRGELKALAGEHEYPNLTAAARGAAQLVAFRGSGSPSPAGASGPGVGILRDLAGRALMSPAGQKALQAAAIGALPGVEHGDLGQAATGGALGAAFGAGGVKAPVVTNAIGAGLGLSQALTSSDETDTTEGLATAGLAGLGAAQEAFPGLGKRFQSSALENETHATKANDQVLDSLAKKDVELEALRQKPLDTEADLVGGQAKLERNRARDGQKADAKARDIEEVKGELALQEKARAVEQQRGDARDAVRLKRAKEDEAFRKSAVEGKLKDKFSRMNDRQKAALKAAYDNVTQAIGDLAASKEGTVGQRHQALYGTLNDWKLMTGRDFEQDFPEMAGAVGRIKERFAKNAPGKFVDDQGREVMQQIDAEYAAREKALTSQQEQAKKALDDFQPADVDARVKAELAKAPQKPLKSARIAEDQAREASFKAQMPDPKNLRQLRAKLATQPEGPAIPPERDFSAEESLRKKGRTLDKQMSAVAGAENDLARTLGDKPAPALDSLSPEMQRLYALRGSEAKKQVDDKAGALVTGKALLEGVPGGKAVAKLGGAVKHSVPGKLLGLEALGQGLKAMLATQHKDGVYSFKRPDAAREIYTRMAGVQRRAGAGAEKVGRFFARFPKPEGVPATTILSFLSANPEVAHAMGEENKADR
jgi:hypothetical protein